MFSRMVPAYKKSSCNTTPKWVRKLLKLTSERSIPSKVTAPFVGFKKVAAKLAIVDFPDPEEPTNAVTLPEGASKDILCNTSLFSS